MALCQSTVRIRYRDFKDVRSALKLHVLKSVPLLCIDGVSVETSIFGFPYSDVENMEILKADAAVPLTERKPRLA